jgi:ankyrin repeat protein
MDKYIKIAVTTACFFGCSVQAAAPNIFEMIGKANYAQKSPYSYDKMERFIKTHPQDINLIGPEGKTPLMYAFERGNLRAINNLLAFQNLNINQQDISGKTALHYAVEKTASLGDSIAASSVIEEIDKRIGMLIAKGANLNIKDKQNRTPFDLATGSTRKLLDDRLLRENSLLLLKGSRSGDWYTVQKAIYNGAYLDVQDAHTGNTPLHYAVIYAIDQIKQNPMNKKDAINFIRLILWYIPSLKIENRQGFKASDLPLQYYPIDLDITSVFEENRQYTLDQLKKDKRFK